MKNTTPSPARITALGKYLVTLSTSFVDIAVGEEGKARGTTARRRRLHVLYLLNDLLHDTKFHSDTPTAHITFTTNLQRYVNDLVKLAASYDQVKNRKCHARIVELLDVWEDSVYFPKETIEALRQDIEDASTSIDGASTPTKDATGVEGESNGTNTRDAPYIMPATHGDPLTPYYDLPAGNMIHLIRPNSPSPIDIRQMKALQLPIGPVHKSLVNAVQEFLKDVDRIYDPAHHDDEGIVADIDEMGQTMVRDEAGDLVPSEAYYGWSLAFCQQMKKRRLEGPPKNNGDRGRGRSRSRSESSTPRKRRRYSSSASYSRSRSRGRLRRHSPSRSGSRSGHRNEGSRSRSSPRRGSRSESRSRRYRSPPLRRLRSRSRSETRSPERPGLGAGRLPAYQQPPTATHTNAQALPPPPPPPQAALQSFFPTPQPFSTQPSMPFPMGPNGMPVPPPPPPNYNGPWPPPPPPLSQSMVYGTQAPSFPQFHGFVPPPPPQMMHGMPFNGQLPVVSSPPNGPGGAWNYPPPQQMQQGGFSGGGGGGGGYGGSPPGRQRGGWNGQRGRGRGM